MPGSGSPLGAPIPNARKYWYCTCGLMCWATCTMPTLLECARTPARVSRSVGCGSASWNVYAPPTVICSGTVYGLIGVWCPAFQRRRGRDHLGRAAGREHGGHRHVLGGGQVRHVRGLVAGVLGHGEDLAAGRAHDHHRAGVRPAQLDLLGAGLLRLPLQAGQDRQLHVPARDHGPDPVGGDRDRLAVRARLHLLLPVPAREQRVVGLLDAGLPAQVAPARGGGEADQVGGEIAAWGRCGCRPA